MGERRRVGSLTDCNHPKECRDEDGECLWCEEVYSLTQRIETLVAVIHKRALVIHDGAVTVHGDIGLLEVRGGTVRFPDTGRPSVTFEEPTP
jgi:hypothetical protein